MADKNGRQSHHKVTAPELLLKVVLAGTQAHYENRGMIDDTRLDHLRHAGKQILCKSHQESDVRYVGFDRTGCNGYKTASCSLKKRLGDD